PSATGGQPACLYFMMKNGIQGSRATVALLVYLVLHIAATILIGAVGLISKPQAFADFELISKLFIIWGAIVITGLVVFFLMLLKHQIILIKGTERFTAFLVRHHVLSEKKRGAIVEKIRTYAENCTECNEMVSNDRKTIVQCFIINLLQRAAQVMIMSFVYLAMGGTAGKAYDAFVTQMFVIIGSCSLPVPGGIGAYDYLMIDGFGELIGAETGIRLELIGRSISFYLEVIISAVIVFTGIVMMHRRNGRQAAAENKFENGDI
ncbi:MAG: YbhN family protein, partial [Anaerovoracaceae bacterium]